MKTLTYGSLFSGIGGIDLGLDRAGFECKWQVEIDPYATKVLAKHWPNVTRYGDIRGCGKHNLAPVDLIAGGFPCQDISIAGKRAGIEGERSGLWKEFYRVICELRPHFILVENVPALLNWGIDTVLGDLATIGYDAEWQVLPASAFGAPHKRERCFIIAYTSFKRARIFVTPTRLHTPQTPLIWKSFRTTDKRIWLAPYCIPARNHDGLPFRVDRLRGLGNAVVPQVAEYVGRCIMHAAEMESAGVA